MQSSTKSTYLELMRLGVLTTAIILWADISYYRENIYLVSFSLTTNHLPHTLVLQFNRSHILRIFSNLFCDIGNSSCSYLLRQTHFLFGGLGSRLFFLFCFTNQ